LVGGRRERHGCALFSPPSASEQRIATKTRRHEDTKRRRHQDTKTRRRRSPALSEASAAAAIRRFGDWARCPASAWQIWRRWSGGAWTWMWTGMGMEMGMGMGDGDGERAARRLDRGRSYILCRLAAWTSERAKEAGLTQAWDAGGVGYKYCVHSTGRSVG
jgi:hypothetical protein